MKLLKIALISICILFITSFLLLQHSWRAPGIPNYTVGYFPFKIIFTIDDEIFSIDDTVRVEFGGSSRGNLMMPARRGWITTLENSDRGWFVLAQHDEGNIEFIVANGSYLMGDPFSGNRHNERSGEIRIWMTWRFAVRNVSGIGFREEVTMVEAHDFLAQNGIKLVYLSIPQSIHNSFR